MGQLFAPSTPLETLIHRGDYQGTLAHLQLLSVGDRKRHRSSIARMIRLIWESGWKTAGEKGLIWGTRSTPEQDRAAAAAILLCGTAEDAAEARLQAGDIVALSREFELPCLPTLADALMRRSPHMIRLVQELIAAGVVARPDSDEYTIGLISLPRNRGRDTSLADYFVADPGLNEAVLRMFEIQGTAEDCLASSDKYNAAANSWTTQLLALCRRGVLARTTLLDKTLSALEQDWPQYRAGWFSRFHKELAPTAAELKINAPRYLQLCHSRIPPTVSLALEALSQLESGGLVDSVALLASLRPVFATGSKGQVEIALSLMDRCLERVPALGVDAALMACAALVQEAPSSQAKLLKKLVKFAGDARVREELRRHLPGLAASNRDAMLKMLGSAKEPVATVQTSPPPETPHVCVSPTAPERRLEPVRDHDELVQLIAYVFENDSDIDAFERALCSLVVSTPIAAGELPGFGPVLKRVAKLRNPVAIELGRLLVFVCHGKRVPAATVVPEYGKPSRIHGLLMARIDDLMDFAEQGRQLPPLSAPTHRRGVIAPAELVSRVQAHRNQGARTSLAEQVLAILRLDPIATDADRQALRALPDDPLVRVLRYALGDDIAAGKQRELFCAAARIRHPRGDDDALLLAYGDLGPDGPMAARYAWEVTSWHSRGQPVYWFHGLRVLPVVPPEGNLEFTAMARHPLPLGKEAWATASRRSVAGPDPAIIAYSATLLPSDLEAFFAEGARELGNNLDWHEARWQNKAYLEALLDATVRPGRMAILMLACALAGKEPGQMALSVDCLVRLHTEGRLEVGALAETLGRLLAKPIVKAARYRKSFDSALRIAPGLAGTIIDLLLPALISNAESISKEGTKLLELVHELLLASGRQLDEREQAGIAALKFGSAGKSIQKKLLKTALRH